MKSLVALAVLLVSLSPMHAASPRDADWKKVEEAVGKGLPQTALEALEPILRGAAADRAWAELTRAIIRKVTLETMIQGYRPEEPVRRFTAALASAPEEIRPLLEVILANAYWQYFQQHRWRFAGRTAVAGGDAADPGAGDLTTWDLKRLFAEIDRHYGAALAAAPRLQQIPIADFDDLLPRGTMPDAYRPTLYDFVARQALEFYSSGEQAGARPQEAFEITADAPVFDGLEAFLVWKPATTETNAAVLRALQIHQDLLRFHAPRPESAAFLDADLARLTWAGNVAVGEGRKERYRAALQRFADRNGDHELAAMALHLLATQWHEEGKLVEAHRLASRGRDAHPASAGGRLCANLVAQIEARSAGVITERIWNAPWPPLKVTYRNVTNVWFRAIPANWDEFLERRHRRPENLTLAERRTILAQPPALTWSNALPATTDFQSRTVELPAPTGLKPGFYFLAASHDPEFREDDNQLSMADIWVSDLALVLRKRAGQVEGFLLEAAGGEPIPSGRIQGWYLSDQGERVAIPEALSDTNGFFTVRVPDRRGVLIKATARGQSVATADEYQRWRPDEPEAQVTATFFFTDRAIYRPGQTIRYKGVCLRADRERDRYEVLPGRALTVIFYDPNNKEVARAEHRANDYGSFSGSFTAPRGRLTGPMRLAVENGPDGGTMFSVEEYKRPKFQVTLDAPATAAKLGGEVHLTGHALAYTGAAVDGAEVRYRVVRQVRMPWWWGWGWRGRAPQVQDEQEIANGTLRTGADGRFEVVFVARPDLAVPETEQPSFEFAVHADVTDGTGETRTGERTIRLGYTALDAMLGAPDWLVDGRSFEFEVRTTTLDGEPQVAEGVVKVFALEGPVSVQRPPLEGDASDTSSWPAGAVVVERGFTTGTNGLARIAVSLPEGAYRAVLETQDRFGRQVTGQRPLKVLAPDADRLGIKLPYLIEAPAWEVQPGGEFLALWGTGYESGRAFVEIEHRGRLIQRYWTRPGATQAQIRQSVTEAMRGGLTLMVTFVRENRAYLTTRQVSVPWSNQELTLRWEHFTSKLQPGQKETWTLAIQGPPGPDETVGKAAAELVATLYDASLDAFQPADWPRGFGVFRQEQPWIETFFGNVTRHFRSFTRGWRVAFTPVEIRYRDLPPGLQMVEWAGFPMGRAVNGRAGDMTARFALAPMAAPQAVGFASADSDMLMEKVVITGSAMVAADAAAPAGAGGGATRPTPAPAQVTARKNLNETAFFFPHLTSDSNGVVRMEFTMPEALTEWRFLGFAHDRGLRSGLLEARTVTARDLMVQPNPPRFLREGDVVEFTVKVSNQSDRSRTGTVHLNLKDGLTDQPADDRLGNSRPEQAFTIPARESRSFAWRITVPDGLSVLTYRAVGVTDGESDGEEGFVPVLARRILVTESLPLPIRGPGTRKFEFTPLARSGGSDTLVHQGVTVQMVSQPAWYAVMALPYLMEFPHECSEQTFNRYYANALARFIASSDPKIRRVFDLWKNTPALDSPLEKNEDLKGVLLEESPWVREAQAESQARRNVGVLFDDNRLDAEMSRALGKLREAQRSDGGWSWFPGGPRNEYITLYIVTGLGRLRHLGVDVPTDFVMPALAPLDAWMAERHTRILKDWEKPGDYVPGSTDALYLYGRSFFLQDQPVAQQHQAAVDFFLARAREHWVKTGNRQTQGHLALALQRFGKAAGGVADPTPADIVKSLKERSVTSEELGRFWRDTERSWWWYHAPIETQALMIEVFHEVAGDAAAVEDCQVWLLKQKQTQNWKTTKATADAVYALLLRGRNLLSSDRLVEVTVGGRDITPKPGPQVEGRSAPGAGAVEPGTGFYEVRFAGSEVRPAMGEITVRKQDAGVAWGSIHWQYLEDMARVPAYTGTPLQLTKRLFTKRNTPQGPVLEPVTAGAAVGDELVVRLELRVDRDMEFVHLKDQRGSGTEPVNVLSGHRQQDGLGYYESTRDTASHFFIDYLPKGTYVFEYSTRIQLRGEYQTGIATIQCMYAPEFNSHSGSLKLVVK